MSESAAGRCVSVDSGVALATTLGRPVEISRERDWPDGLSFLRASSGWGALLQPSELTGETWANYPRTRVISNGRGLRQQIAPDVALSRGHSVIFENVEETLSQRTRLFHAMARCIQGSMTVNAYLTPPRSEALLWHTDNHRVLILQLEGEKHWQLNSGMDDDPRRSRVLDPPEIPAVPIVITLNRGDGLMVPAGLAHNARSGTDCSLHLTVGLRPVSLQEMIAFAADEPEAPGTLEESVLGQQPKYLAERLAAVVKRLQCDNLTLLRNRVLERVICGLPPLPLVATGLPVEDRTSFCLPYSSWTNLLEASDGVWLAAPGLGVVKGRGCALSVAGASRRLANYVNQVGLGEPGSQRMLSAKAAAHATATGIDETIEVFADLERLGVLVRCGSAN